MKKHSLIVAFYFFVSLVHAQSTDSTIVANSLKTKDIESSKTKVE